MGFLRVAGRVVGAGAVAGAGLTAYAAWEARAFVLREVAVPVLPAGHPPLRVLHLTDIHMTPGQSRKQEWLRSLGDLRPDLVISTGDNLGHARSVPVVLDALGTLLDVPGVFVFGSNDYYSPTLRNPLQYLLPDNGDRRTNVPQLPWPDAADRVPGGGLARPDQPVLHRGGSVTPRSRSPASTTRTSGATTSGPSRAPPTTAPTCGWP